MRFLKGDKVISMVDLSITGTVEDIVNIDGKPRAIIFLGYTRDDQWICNRSIYVSRIICDFSSIKRVPLE